jgi:hypothetical protein
MVAIGGGGFIPARMLRTEVCRTHAAGTFRSYGSMHMHNVHDSLARDDHALAQLSASNLRVQWVRTEICHATACSRWPTSARACSLQTIVCNCLKCALRSQAHLAPLSQRTMNTCIPCSHSNRQMAPHGRHVLHANSRTHLHVHSCTFSCTSSPTHSHCVAQVRVPILAPAHPLTRTVLHRCACQSLRFHSSFTTMQRKPPTRMCCKSNGLMRAQVYRAVLCCVVLCCG